MTVSKMLKDEVLFIFLFIFLVDFASTLYLSQSSVTTEPGKSLAIACRDTGGQPVTWKGPKGPLNANTKPKIQDTSIGKLLVFTPTRIQDTGNYTCSLMNNKNDFKVFALVVEVTASDEEPEVSTTSETNENHYNSNRKHPHKHHHNRVHTTHTESTTTEEDTESSTIEYTRPHYESNPDNEATEEPIQFKDTPEIQKGMEGLNVTLRCEVNRPFKINWLPEGNEDKLGTKYIPIGDGLLILNVRRNETNKIFICEVLKSSTGQVIQKKIKFVVEHKPVPVSYTPELEDAGAQAYWAQNDEVYGFQGELVNLTCEVEAEPPPKFNWRGINRGTNFIGRILHEGKLKSILQLKMNEKAVDKYQCIVTNKHGEYKKYFDLKLGTRPNPPGVIQLVKLGSDYLELKVEVPKPDNESLDTGMEARWLNIFYRNENSEDWDEQIFNITLDTFTLTELNSSTKYEVMAASRNVAGLSSLSNNTFFETKSASSVQINNLNFFNVILINAFLFFTSKLARYL